MIAFTQVSDSVPEATGGQLRVEALQPEIDFRGRTPAFFKRGTASAALQPFAAMGWS